MGLKTHLQLRIALMFVGFFGGGGAILYLWLAASGARGLLWQLLFFVLPFGGAYLLPLAFSRLFPAACPKCGGPAQAGTRNLALYVCGDCRTESNALMALMGGETAIRERIAVGGTEGPSRMRKFLRVFLIAGIAAMGFGAWLSVDSVRLVRNGVSVSAQVMKVTMSEGRDKDGNLELRYTAQIQYKVGATPMILERSWTQSPNSRCFSGCYDQGALLKVRYLPTDPGTAKVDSIGDLYLTPGMPFLIGLVFVAFSLLMRRR
jgi:Protein of unknown function (DUF3592)